MAIYSEETAKKLSPIVGEEAAAAWQKRSMRRLLQDLRREEKEPKEEAEEEVAAPSADEMAEAVRRAASLVSRYVADQLALELTSELLPSS